MLLGVNFDFNSGSITDWIKEELRRFEDFLAGDTLHLPVLIRGNGRTGIFHLNNETGYF